MKTIVSTLVSLMITATHAMAAGGDGEGMSLSLIVIFFVAFGALIMLFQAVPALLMIWEMFTGLFSPAATMPAANTDKAS